MSKKKTHKNEKHVFSKKTIKENILKLFNANPKASLNYKQISKALGATETGVKMTFSESLLELAHEGKLHEESVGKFKLLFTGSYLTGVLEMTQNGNAYVVSEEQQEHIYVHNSKLNRALNGDTVSVYLYARRKDRKPEGEVVEVLKRTQKTFVGVVEVLKAFAFLVADNRSMPYDIFIPLSSLNGAVKGQKAIAQITDWPANAKNPIGKITDVLGFPGDNDTEMHAILAEYDLPYKFPEAVNQAAEKIPDTISEEEIARRRDFRNVLTITIDPADAKDFDDALSIQFLPDGKYEIGVHIADVSHYVQPDTILDREAFDRATSVYLVDRTVPMLPEKLSNMVCSLRPNEDKLTYSAVFIMNENAEIENVWFGRTIINSNRRFAYEEAQAIIEGKSEELKEEILTFDRLAKKLRAERFTKGSIAFDRIEIKFNIDPKGKPLSVYFKESKDANKLIEEFMLLANRKVAEFVGKEKVKDRKNFVYRIHDKPDSEKMLNFSRFIKRWGYKIASGNDTKVAQSINKLLDDVTGKPEEDVISSLAIRAMAKAEYHPVNIGHYGLAFDHYTHFTSPIRRYPDVMVHRLLDRYLQGGKSVKMNYLELRCKHSSDQERKAAMAERTSVKYKQVEFMQDKLGQVFDAIISGVTEWGLYAEIIETRIEGMIGLRDLDDDYYVFDDKNYRIVGKASKRSYTLGDKVKIQVVRTNLEKKQIDFVLYKEKNK